MAMRMRALTLPLVFYGIPYASAAVAQTTYIVKHSVVLPEAVTSKNEDLQCSSPSDSASHFLIDPPGDLSGIQVTRIIVLDGDGNVAPTGDNPNGYRFGLQKCFGPELSLFLYIFCETPITTAGISVPEFGSLYLAIALGAIVYFFLARHYTATKPAGIRAN